MPPELSINHEHQTRTPATNSNPKFLLWACRFPFINIDSPFILASLSGEPTG
jgi:hypothetical protein